MSFHESPTTVIVMRTYERPQLLRRALQSVLAQTKRNWLLAIVNNGGVPSVVETVIDEFRAALGERLILFHLKSRVAMEAASNHALRSTSSEFVVIHDDDDAWSPKFLEKTIGYLKSPEGRDDLGVITQIDFVTEAIEKEKIVERSRASLRCDWSTLTFSRVLVTNFPPISFLFRRSLLMELGYFREDLPVLGDLEFNLRVLRRGNIGLVPEVLASYHHRTNQPTGALANSNAQLHAREKMRLFNQLMREDARSAGSGLGAVAQVSAYLDYLEQRFEHVRKAFPKTSPPPLAPDQPVPPAPDASRLLDLSNVRFRSRHPLWGPPVDAVRGLLYKLLWVAFDRQTQHNSTLQSSLDKLETRMGALEKSAPSSVPAKPLPFSDARLPQTAYGILEPYRSFAETTRLRRQIKHHFGPRRPKLRRSEVIVLSVVRNGAAYVESFVKHYFSLGATHIVLLDNDSTDETREIAAAFDAVTVLGTKLPFKNNNVWMRQYLLETYALGRWALIVDIDELFDYPFSNRLALPKLVAYLERHSFTAMLAQMLDMFSDEKLAGGGAPGALDLKSRYPFYDLTDIEKLPYPPQLGNSLASPSIQMHHGGVRGRHLGAGPVCLSKHPLVFFEEGTQLLNPHGITPVRIADVTGTLLHFKFLPDFEQRVKEAATKGNYWNSSQEYRAYAEALEKHPELRLHGPSSRKLESVSQLVDESFLVVSSRYRELALQASPGRKKDRDFTVSAPKKPRDSRIPPSKVKHAIEQASRHSSLRRRNGDSPGSE